MTSCDPNHLAHKAEVLEAQCTICRGRNFHARNASTQTHTAHELMN